MKRITTLVCAVLCVTMAKAQWVDNIEENTLISESGKLFCASAKAVEATNGNIFVTWLSYEGVGQGDDVFSQGMTKLQLLDKSGNALWQKGGIYLSTHPTASWSSDFSIAATPDNCAVIAFSDSRTDPQGKSHFKTYVYKIDQEGNFLWGLDGVALPSNSTECMRPRICVTNLGSVIVGYTDQQEGGFVMNRIDKDGALVWDGFRVGGMLGNFVPCDEDDFIVVTMGGEGAITALRLNAYGEQEWSKAITKENVYGYVEPRIKSDGQNGAIMSYMIQTGTNQEFYVCLQRVNAEGETMMGINPIRTSKEATQHRGVAFGVNADSEQIVSIWEKVLGGMPTLCCNKFNYFGDEQWKVNGIELDNDDLWGYLVEDVVPTNDEGYILFYRRMWGAVDMSIIAQKIDKDGTEVWKQDLSGISYKSTCSVIPCKDQICLVWSDARNSNQAINGEVYGQNISYSGELGVITSIKNTQASDGNRMYYDNVNHTLNVTIADSETPVEIELFNLAGLLINRYQNTTNTNGNVSIEINNLLPGTYIAKIACADNKNYYHKIMVK